MCFTPASAASCAGVPMSSTDQPSPGARTTAIPAHGIARDRVDGANDFHTASFMANRLASDLAGASLAAHSARSAAENHRSTREEP